MITFLLLYKECIVALKEKERKRLLTSKRGWGGKTSQGRGDLMVTGASNCAGQPAARPTCKALENLNSGFQGGRSSWRSHLLYYEMLSRHFANSSATVSHSTITPSGTRQPQGRTSTIFAWGQRTHHCLQFACTWQFPHWIKKHSYGSNKEKRLHL